MKVNEQIDIKQKLLNGECKVAIWGSGFIGGTTAMAFASEGIRVVCYDINEDAVIDINRGVLGVTNLEYWYGATMKEFVDKKLIEATANWHDLKSDDVAMHFVAVPTEKEGEPWDDAILDVFSKINACETKLTIIESTLTPGRLKKMDTKELEIGVAPRRDWFHSPSYNLKNLKRIYAGPNKEASSQIRDVLSIVCDHLIEASSIDVAELVKSVENSLLHIPAVYATQLAHAYPNIDIDEVLQLAATHWRIPHYYPSFGTGGYCIPLSSKYVKYGAENPEALSIVDATLESDQKEPHVVANEVIKRIDYGNVGILGISYKGDLKVHQLSPTLKICQKLLESKRFQVYVNDPYYSEVEAKQILSDEVKTFSLENSETVFQKLDTVIVVTDHKAYGRFSRKWLSENLKPSLLIYDNYGIWKKYEDFFEGTDRSYFKPGKKGWLS